MVSHEFLISLIPLMPLAGFLLLAFSEKTMVEWIAAVIACGSILVSFLLSVTVFILLLNEPESQRYFVVNLFEWIKAGEFSASISFLIDPLSVIMLLIITGVGFLIHIYSIGYMHGDEGFKRFFSYLNLFVFFMLLLVMGANYLLMYVGWEGVGLCSYLLIGFWFKNQAYNDAANKAFIMNRIGDLGMLLGIIFIFANLGTIQYQDVFSNSSQLSPTTVTLITVFLFVGAIGKSAQIPLYTWLPDAMAGPTPVSALIHAATMVTAGVYMVARNNLLYAMSPFTLHLIVGIGLATSILAATIAVKQNDIKKVLAYSTVSQLGLMFLALGLGAFASGIFHMATHAFFKALLFLGAGSVIHALQGQQDIRNMGGLRKYLPITSLTFMIGVLAISGIPPFAGFFSKDEILAHAFADNILVWALAVFASLLTVFYMFRLFFLTFAGDVRADKHTMDHIHESPKTITIPLLALAALSLLGGFMGVPKVLWGSNWIEHFLAPVFAASSGHLRTHELSHTTEYGLMASVIALTLVMIGLAYSRYVAKKRVPVAEGSETGLQKILTGKYYVDEIYDTLIVRPLFLLSEKFELWIEKSGIDKLVNNLGAGVLTGSRVLRLLQNGSIGFYIFVMVIGVVLLLMINNLLH